MGKSSRSLQRGVCYCLLFEPGQRAVLGSLWLTYTQRAANPGFVRLAGTQPTPALYAAASLLPGAASCVRRGSERKCHA